MTYSLTQLAADIRETLKADAGPATKAKVCGYVSKALTDKTLVATHLKDRAKGAIARGAVRRSRARLLHAAATSTTVQRTAPPRPRLELGHLRTGGGGDGDDGLAHREERRGRGAFAGRARQDIPDEPGDAHLYDVGAVHSPKRDAPVKLIRVEGKNLDHVKRSNIKAK